MTDYNKQILQIFRIVLDFSTQSKQEIVNVKYIELFNITDILYFKFYYHSTSIKLGRYPLRHHKKVRQSQVLLSLK